MPPSPKDQELARASRVMFTVSVIAVVLLGPAFLLGYVWGFHSGRNYAAQSSAGAAVDSSPSSVQGVPSTSSLRSAAETHPTASKLAEESFESPRVHEAAASHLYLQLAAVPKNRSADFIELLRRDGFSVLTSDIPEKPDLHRILVGPLDRHEVEGTRAALVRKGFPGDAAMERTFKFSLAEE